MSQHTYMYPYENEYLILNQNTYDHNQQFLKDSTNRSSYYTFPYKMSSKWMSFED